MRTLLRNMGMLLFLIVPVGIYAAGLVLRPLTAEWSTWERVEAFLYFWIAGIPLVAIGGLTHNLTMWALSRAAPAADARFWAVVTAPIVLLWWYLPMNWPLHPSIGDQPLMLLPLVIVVGLYAWLFRPFRCNPRDIPVDMGE